MDSCSNETLLERVNQVPGFGQHNNIRITRIDGRRAEGEMPITPNSLNPRGHVHGGCLVSLADTVGGTAAHTGGGDWVTLSSTFNYLRPGTGSMLYCRAEPQKLGRTVSVYGVVITDDQDRPVANGCFTFYCIGR